MKCITHKYREENTLYIGYVVWIFWVNAGTHIHHRIHGDYVDRHAFLLALFLSICHHIFRSRLVRLPNLHLISVYIISSIGLLLIFYVAVRQFLSFFMQAAVGVAAGVVRSRMERYVNLYTYAYRMKSLTAMKTTMMMIIKIKINAFFKIPLNAMWQ